MGHTVDIATLDDPRIKLLSQDDLSFIRLGPTKFGRYYSQNSRKWIENNISKYDVIIINGLWSYNNYLISKICRKNNKKYFIFPHGMLDITFRKLYPLKHLKKYVYWLLIEKNVINNSEAVIYTCRTELDMAIKTFPYYNAKSLVMNYGINIPPIIAEEKIVNYKKIISNNSENRVLLYLSRIHEKKGCDLLIIAFSEIIKINKNLVLIIAGPGEFKYINGLKNLVLKLGISEDVKFIGEVSDDNKWLNFYSADLFCLPSHQENFGIAIAEALACSLPVLISDKVNIWKDVEEANAGFISPDSIDGVKISLIRWLQLDNKIIEVLRKNARNLFLSKYEMKTAISSLMEIILPNDFK